jgi:hypothetical protein
MQAKWQLPWFEEDDLFGGAEGTLTLRALLGCELCKLCWAMLSGRRRFARMRQVRSRSLVLLSAPASGCFLQPGPTHFSQTRKPLQYT